MTPKQKAIELYGTYFYLFDSQESYLGTQAKKCALIVVDQIEKTMILKDKECGFIDIDITHKEYWQQVKYELINNI